ncbi:MAG: flagellar biosynthetic protein FliO [Candidatus Sulfotelmatobacter sp.]
MPGFRNRELMTREILGVSASAWGRRLLALWERVLRLGRRAPRRLRLCESLPLGERRFVAVVEFDETRFLVGGTPSSLVLLSRLENAERNAEDDLGDAARCSGEIQSAGETRGKPC